MLAGYLAQRQTKNLGGRRNVNVFAAQKSFNHPCIAAHGGDYAKLNLGIVRAKKHPIGAARNKKVAHPLAAFAANRDVLHVGIGRRKPPRSRNRLVEGRMDASGARIHQLGERIDVGAFELAYLPPFQ